MPTWYTPDDAQSELGIRVSQRQLDAAREQCLRIKGLALTLPTPPSESFAQGVVYQALANKQASQAAPGDEMGGEINGVRVYPLDRKILAMLIIPAPTPGAVDPVTVEWPDGSAMAFTRDGDVVTATATRVGAAGATTPTAIPAGFAPVGGYIGVSGATGAFFYSRSASSSNAGKCWVSGVAGSAVVTYLGEPLPTPADARDTGYVGSLIG